MYVGGRESITYDKIGGFLSTQKIKLNKKLSRKKGVLKVRKKKEEERRGVRGIRSKRGLRRGGGVG